MSFFAAMASLTASSYEGTNEAVLPPTSGPTSSHTELEQITVLRRNKKRQAAQTGSPLADDSLWDNSGIMDDTNRLDETRLLNVRNDGDIRNDPAHGLSRMGSD